MGGPGTFLLNLADAFELGCRFNALRPGLAVPASRANVDILFV